jgi:hypothetical protein
MTNRTIRQVVILGAIAIVALVSVQTYWIVRMWDLQEQDFNRRVRQALLETARDLARIGLFVLEDANLIQQVQSNYYIVNINNQFDEASLEFYLQNPLKIKDFRKTFSMASSTVRATRWSAAGWLNTGKKPRAKALCSSTHPYRPTTTAT